MPPLPKRKHSTARKGKRRATLKLSYPTLGICPNCGAPKRSHAICPHCGAYKGKVVLAPKEKKEKPKK